MSNKSNKRRPAPKSNTSSNGPRSGARTVGEKGRAGTKGARVNAGQPGQPQTTGLMQAWRSLSRRWQIFGVIVSIVAGWQTLNDAAIQPLMHLYESRQPEHDERILADLRAGILFSEFQRILHSESVSVLYDDIGLPSRVSGPARDEFFMLPTAYVEAFVDRNEIVAAYTVTARGDKMPQVKTPLGTIHLGSTHIAEAPTRAANIQDVAFVCGAHIEAYYEITGTSIANLSQTYAYGYTGAGGRPKDLERPTCPPASPTDVPLDTSVAHETAESRHHIIDMYSATAEFLEQVDSYRSEVYINTLTVTAPEVPLSPQMISLHPEAVASLDSTSHVY